MVPADGRSRQTGASREAPYFTCQVWTGSLVWASSM